MGREQKLIERLYSKPKDYKWSEAVTLLKKLGFKKIEGSGSRVKFFHENPRTLIIIHRPHPGNVLKAYVVKDLINKIKEVYKGSL
ncbi:type II toxin-antitoxin system HicA family toxin [Desulfobacter sp.]